MKKQVKKVKKSVSKKSVARRKAGRPKSSVKAVKLNDEEEKAHKAAIRAAKKVEKISGKLGVSVQTFSGDVKTLKFETGRRSVQVPVETLRTLRSKVTGETITLIHNVVARFFKLADRLDFRIRDPRNVQYVRLNTEGVKIS